MKSWTLFLVAIAACDGGSDEPPQPPAETDADADADADADSDADADTDAQVDYAALSGTLKGPSGSGLLADLRLCRGAVCLNGDTNEAGEYAFEEVYPDKASFEVIPEDDSLATAFAPLTFSPLQARSLDWSTVAISHTHALTGTGTEVELGEGLFVTVDDSSLEPPTFYPEATEVTGVQVPQAAWPPIDSGETPVAVWYLGPFDYHAPDGLPFRIEAKGFTLDAGASYDVWVGSYELSEWVVVGTLTESGGQLAGSSVELSLLSTVVLLPSSN